MLRWLLLTWSALTGHALEEWNSSRIVEAASQHGLDDLGSLWEGGGGSVCDEQEHTLSNVHFTLPLPADGGHSHVPLAESQTSCISPSEGFASGIMQNQGRVSDPNCPELAESTLFFGPQGDAGGSPFADSAPKGHAVSSGQLDMAPQPRAVEPSCVATEFCAPSTRCLYALK